MKHLYLIFIAAFSMLCAVSCAGDDLDTVEPSVTAKSRKTVAADDVSESYDPEAPIVLVRKLENPYSVVNMRLAYKNLLAANPSIKPQSVPSVRTSHYYVKFKPATDDELKTLQQDTMLLLYEYPLDYEFEGGTSYHDPEIPDSLPTYQYASVEQERWIAMKDTLSVAYEVLEELFIPDEDSLLGDVDDDETESPIAAYALSADGSGVEEWAVDALVEEALRITGNEEPMTRSNSKWRPSGSVKAYDNIVDGMVPLKGLKVRARRWFTTHRGYTDADGKFVCDGTFKRPANYSIAWESGRFDIRDGNIVQAYYNGPKQRGSWNLEIDGGKSLRYATIYRAAYRFYHGNTYGLTRPSNKRKEKIAYIHKKGDVNGDYNRQLGSGVWSDIRIFGKNDSGWRESSEIFSTTCHELGHSAHYTNASYNYKNSTKPIKESWARCVQYHLTNEEYKELGVFDKLNSTINMVWHSSTGLTKNIKKAYIQPDYAYNYQGWSAIYTDENMRLNYTPLFIDLIDSYNQRNYWKSYNINFNKNIDITNYPDDRIHFPISAIENIVFKSRSLSDVKTFVKTYAKEYIKTQSMFEKISNPVNDENIDKLFETYESLYK